MGYFSYMARCADGSLYSGYTNDIDKRMAAHNSGRGSKYTCSRRPVKLAYFEKHETKSEAMKREAAYKKLPKAEKEALVSGFALRYQMFNVLED